MAADTITFACPACNTRLTLPIRLVGVTGPCPNCRSLIQAPRPVAPQAQPGLSTPPLPASTPQRTTHEPKQPFRPEPRQLPQRPDHLDQPIGKPMPEPHVVPPGRGKSHRGQYRHRRKFGLLIPVFFVTAAVGVILALWISITKTAEPEPAPVPPIGKTAPPESTPPPSPTAAATEPPAIPPSSADQATNAQRAYACLETFLNATTLEERAPILESKLPTDALAETILAGPLPKALRYATEFQQTDPIENLVEFYCSVDFDAGNGLANPQTVLVRIRGAADPKIVVDPFLDLFGGRLAKFAGEPTVKGATFEVIASAVAHCYNKEIPNREQKLTLKLLARDNTRPIAEAYFNKFSKIGLMLADDTSGFRYGQAQPCTLLLRWNLEEDPQRPYLEALDIRDLNWNH